MIYVIAGKETSLLNDECQKLLDNLIAPSQRPTGLLNVDTAKVTASQVFDELRTAPFLSEKRVVLVKDADDFVSKNRQLLEKYFDNPCPTGILVLTINSWPSQTKLARKLPKVGKLISITIPKPWQLPARLSQYADEAHGKKLAWGAAELLIELSGDNLSQLYSQIDKLALFAHGEKAITIGHVELLIGHNRLFNCFSVIDSCLAGNTAQAVDRLRKMFAEDKSAEYTAVGAFAFHLRRQFRARVLLDDGRTAAEIAGKLRIWANKEAFFSQTRKMSLKKIGSLLQKICEIDYAIKTGRAKPQQAAEQLVLELAADFKR